MSVLHAVDNMAAAKVYTVPVSLLGSFLRSFVSGFSSSSPLLIRLSLPLSYSGSLS